MATLAKPKRLVLSSANTDQKQILYTCECHVCLLTDPSVCKTRGDSRGALKSNIGHLEGASGLAALIKTILVLKKGIIPPNANFEKLNPKIDAEFLKLNVSLQLSFYACARS